MDRIKLVKVYFVPAILESGQLYVSLEFGIAAHLCPCGCGNKIITPLGPVDWSFTGTKNKPSLYPSIGNWQLPCKSHYWISDGRIIWSREWTEEEIRIGFKAEERRREAYYDNLHSKRKRLSLINRALNWFLR